MRPRHPQWSCIKRPQRYPIRVLPRPPASFGSIHAVKVGPLMLGDSEGSINNRYWVCYQESGNVYLRGAIDDLTWSAATLVFAEAEGIEALDFTFDQLGREIVFYQVGTELRLWYFDSLATAFIKRVIDTNAEQPLCGFDLINDTSNPMSDAHIFYVKDGSILERIQRDRYNVVYDAMVSYGSIKLKSCGMTAENRFQVEYAHRNQRDGIEKKKVYQTAAPVMDNFNNQVFEFGFDIGPNFNSKCIPRNSNNELDLTILEHSSNTSLIPDTQIRISLRYTQNEELPIIGIFSYVLNVPLQYIQLSDHMYKGSYRFIFSDGSIMGYKNIKFYRNGVLISNSDVAKPFLNYSATSSHRLKFGAADAPISSDAKTYYRCLPAQFLNMYCIIDGVRTDWPITAGLPVTTPSVPVGNSMTVYIDGKDGVTIL